MPRLSKRSKQVGKGCGGPHNQKKSKNNPNLKKKIEKVMYIKINKNEKVPTNFKLEKKYSRSTSGERSKRKGSKKGRSKSN